VRRGPSAYRENGRERTHKRRVSYYVIYSMAWEIARDALMNI